MRNPEILSAEHSHPARISTRMNASYVKVTKKRAMFSKATFSRFKAKMTKNMAPATYRTKVRSSSRTSDEEQIIPGKHQHGPTVDVQISTDHDVRHHIKGTVLQLMIMDMYTTTEDHDLVDVVLHTNHVSLSLAPSQ